MAGDAIRVEGLDDFRKELRALDPKLSKDLGAINQRVAQPIAADALTRAESLGGAAGKGAATIKAARKAKAAVITLGGAKAPFMYGAEFGAKRYAQFKPWRGNQFQPDTGNVGYFLHPAIREGREEFEKNYFDAIEELASGAFNK